MHSSFMKLAEILGLDIIIIGEVTDEQLLAEVARRKLDLHDKITDSLVRETYEVGKIIGHGASGEVHLVTHKVNFLLSTAHGRRCTINAPYSWFL